MFATSLIEGETDAVLALSSATRPARLRYVGTHFSSWWWPALGGEPATGQGVLIYASTEQFHPVMVKPMTSSSRAISHAT